MRFAPILILILGALGALGLSSIYIVDERQQALVLQFGRIEQVRREPGLYFKLPAPVNTVEYYDDRILPMETSDLEVTPLDNRRLLVNAFARYRISDAERFYQAVRFQGQEQDVIRRILNARLREVLGSVNSAQILSNERAALTRSIRDGAREQANAVGVTIVDVRIKRADLPPENLSATYERMRAEREQEARDEIARGQEAARITRAQADRQATVLRADARRQSEIIRGQADAERNRIFADAFGRDAEFFDFYRSMLAYEEALRGENSTMVLSPDSEFFSYFETIDRGGAN